MQRLQQTPVVTSMHMLHTSDKLGRESACSHTSPIKEDLESSSPAINPALQIPLEKRQLDQSNVVSTPQKKTKIAMTRESNKKHLLLRILAWEASCQSSALLHHASSWSEGADIVVDRYKGQDTILHAFGQD